MILHSKHNISIVKASYTQRVHLSSNWHVPSIMEPLLRVLEKLLLRRDVANGFDAARTVFTNAELLGAIVFLGAVAIHPHTAPFAPIVVNCTFPYYMANNGAAGMVAQMRCLESGLWDAWVMENGQ
jgi:hypothetical protein